mmetsp:Transcript_20789/g.52359  ORF Transcript_20789/g.52359 Transcript_20789/m.52359 type:complete len:1318 (-) Transcript_20789:253-4206(-)
MGRGFQDELDGFQELQHEYERVRKRMQLLQRQQKQRQLVRGFMCGPGASGPSLAPNIDPIFEECRRKRMSLGLETGGEKSASAGAGPAGAAGRVAGALDLELSSLSSLLSSPSASRKSKTVASEVGGGARTKNNVDVPASGSGAARGGAARRSFQLAASKDEPSATSADSGAEQPHISSEDHLQNDRNNTNTSHATSHTTKSSPNVTRKSHQLVQSENQNPNVPIFAAAPTTSTRAAATTTTSQQQSIEKRILRATASEFAAERNAVVRETAQSVQEMFYRVHHDPRSSTTLQEASRAYAEEVVNRWPVWYEDVQRMRDGIFHEGDRLSTLKWNAEHCREVMEVQQGLADFKQKVQKEVYATNVADLDEVLMDEDEDDESCGGSGGEERDAVEQDVVMKTSAPCAPGGVDEKCSPRTKSEGKLAADYFAAFTREPNVATAAKNKTSVGKKEARQLRTRLQNMWHRLRELEKPLPTSTAAAAGGGGAAASAGPGEEPTLVPRTEAAPAAASEQGMALAGDARPGSGKSRPRLLNASTSVLEVVAASPPSAATASGPVVVARTTGGGGGAAGSPPRPTVAVAGSSFSVPPTLTNSPSLIDPTPPSQSLLMKPLESSPSILIGGPGPPASAAEKGAAVGPPPPRQYMRASGGPAAAAQRKEPTNVDLSYNHPTPPRGQKTTQNDENKHVFRTPDLGPRELTGNNVEALFSARTADSEGSQDLLSIAHDYQRSRNASEVPAGSSARPSPRENAGFDTDLKHALASTSSGRFGLVPLAEGQQDDEDDFSAQGTTQDLAAHATATSGPPESILVGSKLQHSHQQLRIGHPASRVGAISIHDSVSVDESKDGRGDGSVSSRANISSIAAEESVAPNLHQGGGGERHQRSVMFGGMGRRGGHDRDEDDSQDDDDVDEDDILGASSASQEEDINVVLGRRDEPLYDTVNKKVLAASSPQQTDSATEYNAPPKSELDRSEGTIRQRNMMTARDSTATITEMSDVSHHHLQGSRLVQEGASASVSGRSVAAATTRQQPQELPAAQGAQQEQHASTSSSSQQNQSQQNQTTATYTSSSTAGTTGSRHGSSHQLRRIAAPQTSYNNNPNSATVLQPTRARAGEYSVANQLRKQVNADLSVKLFCFAFLAELVEDQLQHVDDLRDYLGRDVFAAGLRETRSGNVKTWDLDFIFRFLLDIQEHTEETIEEFFEADNLAVEHIHAALFLVPDDTNPQFQKVMREHCQFLEARRGRGILEESCDWYRPKTPPSAKSAKAARGPGGGPAGGFGAALNKFGGGAGFAGGSLQLNPAFLGTSAVAVDNSEFAEISDL